MQENEFDLAILFHWFWNGISIPEHYMQEIRQLSPKTFIAVLTDDQQGVREMQMASLTGYWADYERSYDFTMPGVRRVPPNGFSSDDIGRRQPRILAREFRNCARAGCP